MKHRLKADHAVLVIIDVQEKLMPVIKDAEMIIAENKKWLKIAKTLGIPIFATEQYPRGLGATVDALDFATYQVHVVEKMSFGGPPKELAELLEQSGRKQLILTGAETHICVFQMCRDLIGLGYDVYIPQEAVGSRFDLNRINGFELIREEGGIVSNTETMLFDMLEASGTPEFKELSKLIK